MSRNRNGNRWWIRAVIGGCLGVVLGSGCHPKHEPEALPELPSVDVGVTIASTGTRRATEEVVGTVRARLRSAIEAKVSGRIARLTAAPGQAVARGDVLAELDVGEIQARVEQARAVLVQAERELARFRTLLGQQAVTQSEFDAVEARHRVAKAAVAEAETLLGYAQVTAPFAGIITRKLADVGDLATPGRPLLELEDPGSLRFEADVPVTWSDRVKLGDRLPVTLASAGSGLEGVVSEMDPGADPVSRTFRIRLDLPADAGARAGLFGRVSIPMGESTVLTVPTNAVTVRGQMELAFVEKDGRARLRLVRTGKVVGGDVEILSGIDAGERVVVKGVSGLVDGQRVEVR